MDLTSFIKSQNFRNTMNSQPGIMGNLSGGNLPSFGMGGGGNTPGVNLPGGNLPSFGMGGGGNALSTNPFGLANTMTPNPNQGGFARGIGGALSNIGGFVQNNQRFGDALAGAAILGGTPIADAFAVRETINPTDNTIGKSVGTLYNIRNSTTGQLTGEQVYSTDSVKMNEIAKDPNLILEEVGEAVPSSEAGDVPKGYVQSVDEQGNVTLEFIPGYNEDETLDEMQRLDSLERTTKRATGEMEDNLKILINFTKNNTSTIVGGALLKAGGEGAVNAAIELLTSDGVSEVRGAYATINANRFVNAITDMRNASKTGGAVGQVTEREMDVLRASRSNLAPFAGAAFTTQLAKMLGETVNARKEILFEIDKRKRILTSKLSSTTQKALSE